MKVLITTNTIRCVKAYNKATSCAKLEWNTLDDLLRLNLLDDIAVLQLLVGP